MTAAFERVSRDCAKRAWALAYSLMGNATDADDVMQKAYVVAWKRRGDIPEDPWPWVAAIVVNCARHFRRKEARVFNREDAHWMAPVTHAESPDTAAQRNEALARLRDEMRQLAPDEQEAIALCHIGGMTQAQACQVAGVPIRTLKFRVQKGMSRLRRRLKPYAVEGLLGVGLFPPPDGGWEAAIGRWQGVAISAPAMAGIGSAIVAAVLLATAVSVVAWAVQDASPTDKSPHQAAVDAGSATTRSAVPPSEPSAGAEVLVDCPIVPPAVERAPDAGAVAGKVAASPSGPVPVGSTRVCFCYYESGFPQARWTERVTPTGAVKEGDVTFWYPNGNVHHQGRLEDGAREGEWTRYWEDGRLSDRGNYRRSKREGFWMYMYDEGKPMSAGLCVNGLMEGQWRGWHENGQVSSEWTAVNDKFDGESRHYDEQGVLRQEINWDHGVKLREIRYDDQGNATTRIYENGKLVRTEPGSQD